MSKSTSMSSPPENLAKECTVCGEEIKKHNCIHYGGLSCYSCRAFFRRTHAGFGNIKAKKGAASEAVVAYVCKFEGRCEVTVKSRRRCQRCRYEKCLEAGMRPEQVLNEKEKEFRFRKHLQKQKKASSSSSNNQSRKGAAAAAETPIKKDIEKPPAKKSEPEEIKVKNEIKEEMLDEEDEAGKVSLDELLINISSDDLDEILENVSREFASCLTANNNSNNNSNNNTADSVFAPEIALKLLNFHLNESVLDKSELDELLRQHVNVFLRDVARQSAVFAALDGQEQIKLLHKNRLIYVNFLLARYFTADNAVEQLYWLLPKDVSTPEFDVKALCFVPFRNVIFFPSHVANNRYLQHAYQVKSLSASLNLDLFSRVILFYPDGEFAQNTAVQTEFQRLCSALDPSIDLNSLLLTLNVMTDLFEANYVWSGNSVVSRSIPLPYTEDEHVWLNRQMSTFDSCMRTISMGEDLIREFIMHTYNMPVSPQFLIKSHWAVEARFKEVLKMHPEFHLLSINEQSLFLRANVGQATGLYMLMLEGQPSGMEQLRCMTGEMDSIVWKNNFRPYIKDNWLKKLTMKDFQPQLPQTDPIMVQDFLQITHQMSVLLQNPDVFRLLVLLTLTSDYTHAQSMRHIKAKYESAIQRLASSSHNANELASALHLALTCQMKLASMAAMFSMPRAPAPNTH